MDALIQEQPIILMVIFVCVAAAFVLRTFKFGKYLSPALISILLGIILSNLNIMPHSHDTYNVFLMYSVPLALTMMLLNVDLKALLKLSKQPLIAMLLAVLSVCIVTFFAGLAFTPQIEEGWKVAGMFIGTYTGGSSNLTAIGTGLNASPATFAIANGADYVVGMPLIVLFFALPTIINKSKWIKKVWPYSLSDEELKSGEGADLFSKKNWDIKDIAVLFAISFMVMIAAFIISSLFPESISSAIMIIAITTISLGLAQIKKIRAIEGSVDLGFFVAMPFILIIGFMVDIPSFMDAAPLVALFCLTVILGSMIVHVILCRIFKIKIQYVLISIVAGIGDGSAAALVAGSGEWKSLMSVAIVLGAMGAALGNYVGLGLAHLIRIITGAG